MKRRLICEESLPDEHTLLLLHFDGDVKDSCGNVVSGSIADYQQGRFGLCGKFNRTKLEFDKSVFNFLSDFTVDFWYKADGQEKHDCFLDSGNRDPFSGIRFLFLNYADLYRLSIMYSTSGGMWEAVEFPYRTLNESLHHIALVRHESAFYCFIDGALIGIEPAFNSVIQNSSTWSLGCSKEYGMNHAVLGLIDEFRISNIARWTSNFTPPTKPY